MLISEGESPMEKVLTTCGYCGCGCNYYVNIVDKEIVGITPKYDHPVSKGKLCVKGWQGYTFVNHPDRLRKPLIKQRDGSFKETTWEKAMEHIGKSFRNVISNYGSSSIGVLSSARCTNEENYLLVKLARSILKTSNIDHCARL